LERIKALFQGDANSSRSAHPKICGRTSPPARARAAARVYTITRGAARARVLALTVRCDWAHARAATNVAAAARGLARRSTFLRPTGQAPSRAEFYECDHAD
jgi:hypothetical protein